MDLSADSGTLPTHTTVGESVLEQEPSLPSAQCQTESGGTLLLQLLEFKTHLLEAVEELHIRRDAETRFEDQISKLVLEKQELEWEKESLQHQTETMAKQHTQSLSNVKQQFQAIIRSIEEEKGKYHVSAELKDIEINNLKEELKSLQLLKYNLEKKTSELEQKLALQSRSKDSHLKQLGEVEKRFIVLSRQCAMVKQAHEKLEQNVDEAMKRNNKLTSVNEKQEAIIASLKKELDEVGNKLIKAMMSSARDDRSRSPMGGEQSIQQLHQKLNVEIEMNKKLTEENAAVRAEKQEVMRSTQHTQQLLFCQTQTVSRVELELQTQREQYQALKQEHEVMREKSKATEDKVAKLMESYAASKTSWDKEKAVFQDRVRSKQQELQAVNEAYSELLQKHTELTSQAKVHTQLLYELERRDSSQNLSGATKLFPTLVEKFRGDQTLVEPVSSSEPPSFGSLQHLASTQTKKPDCLEDTGAATMLDQDSPDQRNKSHFERPLNPSNVFTCALTNSNLSSLCGVPGTTDSDSSLLKKYSNNSNTSESDPVLVSHLIQDTSSSVSGEGLLMSKDSCVSNTSIDGSVDLVSKEKSDGGTSEEEQRWNDDVKGGKSNREREERSVEQEWNREEAQEEGGGSAAESGGTLMAQTKDRADRREERIACSETETKEGEETDGAEERERTWPCTPQNQIPTQTATDTTTEKSNKQQVIDLMDSESPLAACEPSNCSQSLSQEVSEKVADFSYVNKEYEIRRKVQTSCFDEHQSVSHGPNSGIQEMQHLCHEEVHTFAQDLLQVSEKTTEEKPPDRSVASVPTELSQPPNHSSICSSQTNTAVSPAQLDNIVSIQELETTATQTQPSNPSDITSNMKQTDEMYHAHVSEDMVLVTKMVEPQPQSQGISEEECGQLRSVVTDDGNDDCSTYKKKREGQSKVDTWENYACEAVQEPVEKSNSKETCIDITMDPGDLETEGETGSCQERTKNEEVDAGDATKTDSGAALNMSAHPSHENDAVLQFPAKEMLLDVTNGSSLPSSKTCRSAFDWDFAQKKGFPTSEQDRSSPGGLLRHPSSVLPMFLRHKHNKAPLVNTRASDLLNASSDSGTAASSRSRQQGETCRKIATADVASYRAGYEVRSFSFVAYSQMMLKNGIKLHTINHQPDLNVTGEQSFSVYQFFSSLYILYHSQQTVMADHPGSSLLSSRSEFRDRLGTILLSGEGRPTVII
uniref:coiled-coil domain-containing protein 73-like isoform X2 n=1 Tax=Scatophagus argus TaxID=75038 RepID=UPI001ED813CE|nr:coiled-coil domain-containing protein 73-like isoform X2 [Scatophagus argus]